MYYGSAQGLQIEARKEILQKEREKYTEKFESGEIDPNKVIKEFKSRSLVSRLFAGFEDTIRYRAAVQYMIRKNYF